MLGLLVSVTLAASAPPAHSADICGKIPRAAVPLQKGSHATVADLMALRDIGGLGDDEPPFSISPDGRQVAVVLRQADPEHNDFCQAIVVVDIISGKVADPILLDDGIVFSRYDLPNISDFSGGVIATNVPRWSPDGKWLAFLEHQKGIVQVMRVAVGGGMPMPVTDSAADIRSFSWSGDGSEILYSSRPEESAAINAVREEGRQGFRFDARWIPEWRLSPSPVPSPVHKVAISLSSGVVRDIQPAEGAVPTDMPLDEADDGDGNKAQLLFVSSGVISGPKRISVIPKAGMRRECRDAGCALAFRLWWHDRRHLLFARRAGWGNNLTELISWDIEADRKRRLMQTTDQLSGCRTSLKGLICVIEGAKSPRRLVRINYRTGARTILLDPNPQWGQLELGHVRRIYWQNAIGLKTFGDLVLPPGQENATGLPLIIVGYRSRGFLRGGSGDLFPIYPLAAKGFAVLVYERPEQIGYLHPVKDQAEADRRDFEDWADKKSGASSIMTAVSMLVKEGVVDPERIGLTGFSDGVDKATYTLIHNDIFKAVAMAGCCSDPVMVNAAIGPYLSKVANAAGYPAYRDRGSAHVRDYSLAANAETIKAPILIQLADREYMRSLEVEAAFRQAGKPLSLYVFPDEYHIFWQPAHRMAAYERNIAWFDYHLLKGGKGLLPALLKPLGRTD